MDTECPTPAPKFEPRIPEAFLSGLSPVEQAMVKGLDVLTQMNEHQTRELAEVKRQTLITKSGGTLIMGPGVTLIPNSAKNSINAGTAQNVINYGYVAKYAKGANITLKVNATETVSTDVA